MILQALSLSREEGLFYLELALHYTARADAPGEFLRFMRSVKCADPDASNTTFDTTAKSMKDNQELHGNAPIESATANITTLDGESREESLHEVDTVQYQSSVVSDTSRVRTERTEDIFDRPEQQENDGLRSQSRSVDPSRKPSDEQTHLKAGLPNPRTSYKGYIRTWSDGISELIKEPKDEEAKVRRGRGITVQHVEYDSETDGSTKSKQ